MVRCCRRCGVAGAGRVPPAPLGWYWILCPLKYDIYVSRMLLHYFKTDKRNKGFPLEGISVKFIEQAGAELCQAPGQLRLEPLAWNFALAGAAYSASCG